LGGGGSFQIFAKAPDQRTTLIVFKDHPERGDTHRVYDGKVGWNKTPRNAVPLYQLSGSELDGVRVDALLSFPGNIKTALTVFAPRPRILAIAMSRWCRAAVPTAFW